MVIRHFATLKYMQLGISPQLYLHSRFMLATGYSLLFVTIGCRRSGLCDFSMLQSS